MIENSFLLESYMSSFTCILYLISLASPINFKSYSGPPSTRHRAIAVYLWFGPGVKVIVTSSLSSSPFFNRPFIGTILNTSFNGILLVTVFPLLRLSYEFSNSISSHSYMTSKSLLVSRSNFIVFLVKVSFNKQPKYNSLGKFLILGKFI